MARSLLYVVTAAILHELALQLCCFAAFANAGHPAKSPRYTRRVQDGSSRPLPFELPFNASEYNTQHLSETNGEGDSAAIAFWRLSDGKIQVAMATTQSFVALGLNPSTPSMSGADIVACHRECHGVVARDYFAAGYGTPQEDVTNDWSVVASGSGDGIGVWCVITRPLETCNAVEDFQLVDAAATVSGLLAFGTQRLRPELHYHGMNRKFTSFIFDEAVVTAEQLAASQAADSEQRFEHIITSPVSVVPDDSTGAEICSYHKLPEDMRGPKKHVVDVGFDQPVADAQAQGLTHHTILYGCPQEVADAVDGAEIDCAKTWEFCGSDWLGGRLIRSNEGIPVGQNIVVASILLRHFYNPQLLKGYQDQNRWKIFYTPQLRAHEPVEINLQTTYLDIPAKSKSVASAYMPAECTQRVGEITIEAVRHHMHDYGVAGRLRHIRGDQELAPIHDLESYTRGVSEGWISVSRRILPGDMLIYECVYENTLDQALIWGERREDEMCVIALKTKGTNISQALSWVPAAGDQNPSTDSYRFICKALNYMGPILPAITISKDEFEARIAGIRPYTPPVCTSAGPTGSQAVRALPKSCPRGFRQPATAEECKAANPSQASAMKDCNQWGKENPSAPAPRCFSHLDTQTFCWKSNGAEETVWGRTLVWCVSEPGTSGLQSESTEPCLDWASGVAGDSSKGRLKGIVHVLTALAAVALGLAA